METHPITQISQQNSRWKVERRIAQHTISNKVHPTQAGPLPKRSAIDLVTALIQDVEQELALEICSHSSPSTFEVRSTPPSK